MDNNLDETFATGKTEGSAPPGYVNTSGRILSLQDEKELKAQRGFLPETLKTLRFFTATEGDLPTIGVTIPFSKLSSTIVLPYLNEQTNGKTLVRIHKASAEGFQYPPYVTPQPLSGADIVVCESEIKAGIAFQYGDRGVGLQGTHSFLNRIPILANAVRAWVKKDTRVFVVPDHERLLVDGNPVVYLPTIQMLRLAYSLGIDLGHPVNVIALPDRYMKPAKTHSGEPKIKADLDDCAAAGLTQDEWKGLKDTAKAPWDFDAPLSLIVEALALGDPDEFLNIDILKGRLAGIPAEEIIGICKSLCKAFTARSWNEATKSRDAALYEIYAKAAVRWARKNGLSGVTYQTFKSAAKDVPVGEKNGGELLAHCMVEELGRVALMRKGAPAEIVASFTIESCEYGEVHYAGSATHRRYRVKAVTRVGDKSDVREIILDGDLYDAEQYTAACPDLAVADGKRFKMYVGEKLKKPDFQRHNPALDEPLFVGITKVQDRIFAASRVTFPRKDQDCLYHDHKFQENGDANESFQQVARISRFNDVALTHLLGSTLKQFLGAYPHATWVGSRHTGKTTTTDEIVARTGLLKVSAPDQFSSRYRQLRALGNHNIAVFVEEAPRLAPEWLNTLTATLNTAYNGAVCTHGPEGHYYIAGCAILIGQDRAFTDEALESKQVVIHFSPDDLSQDAILTAKKERTPFPFKKWLDYVAANGHEAQNLINKHQQRLRGKLIDAGVACTGTDRALFNYAAVLVTAELLHGFGVKIDVDTKVVELCQLHLAGKLHAGDEHPAATSSAQKFLSDALSAFSTSIHAQKLAGAFDIRPVEGAWFCVEPVFDYLKRLNPNSYDVCHAARMGGAISVEFKTKGAKKCKHTYGTVRKESWFLPSALCIELGVEWVNGDSRDDAAVT